MTHSDADVVIPVHRVATIWLLIGSGALIGFGLVLPVFYPTLWGWVAGLIIMGLFGIHAYWWTAILRSSGLRLTRDAMEFGGWRLSWSEVAGFYTRRLFGTIGPPTYVRADMAPGAERSNAVEASYLLGTWLSVCGPPLYISTWAFDSDGPLCDTLEAWRLRYRVP